MSLLKQTIIDEIIRVEGGFVIAATAGAITLAASGLEYPGVLSNADTVGLAVGYWYIHGRLTDADEDLREIKVFYVRAKWVG